MTMKLLSPNVLCRGKGLSGVHLVNEAGAAEWLTLSLQLSSAWFSWRRPHTQATQQPARRKGLIVFPFLPLIIGILLMTVGNAAFPEEGHFNVFK